MNHADYPDNPTGSDTLTSFQAVNWNNPNVTSYWANDYGQRIYGFLHPGVSGNYTFWIASDDASQLYLSSDTDPANAALIAYTNSSTAQNEWNKYSSQKSASIYLNSGQVYYIEAVHKEVHSNDHISVGWAQPGEGTSVPSEIIPGSELSPWFSED